MTLLQKLQEPFAAAEIRWRVGTVAKNHKRATLLAYIDARAAMDRLDEAVGPERWQDSYREGAQGGLICRIEILVPPLVAPLGATLPSAPDRWVGKEDGAENTKVEAVKGGMSDAFKRCGVKWGIGRYLYRLPADWHGIQGGEKGWANGNGVDVSVKKGNDRFASHIGWIPFPKLPAFAMPTGRKETKSEREVRQGQHDESWPGAHKLFMVDIRRLGWNYEGLCAEMERQGRHPRPSQMLTRERVDLIRDIDSGSFPIGPLGRQE